LFQQGEIVYFTPFYFKNGNTAKDKYFIILKVIENQTILASLPTSINKGPAFIGVMHGCINHDDRCFNCYLFEQGKPVCTNGFSFPLPTHVYGNEVEDYQISILSSVYGIEGVDFFRVGVLTPTEFSSLISCIKNSESVRNKIKRSL
jgi:hypothetical protein